MGQIYQMTAKNIVESIRKKQISAEEAVKEYLSRIRKYDGKGGLNAVCEINEEAVREARVLDSSSVSDDLPLKGLPILVKDNIDVAGFHTTAGSAALKDHLAKKDARIIQNLRQRGALVLGKTNMTEFANYVSPEMPNGYSSLYGQVQQAYGAKDPGGSSSGSAVAVSAGLCAAAIGTDTSFSIVGCAAVNGVAGYKPPHLSLSSDGIIPLAKTLDAPGPLARSLADAWIVYNGMRAEILEDILPAKPEGLHIAVNSFNRQEVSEAQLSRYARVLNALQKDGGRVSEVTHAYTPYQKDMMRCEFQEDLEQYLSSANTGRRTLKQIIDFYEQNPDSMQFGMDYLVAANEANKQDSRYITARSERERERARLLEELQVFDACLMTGPTNIMHFIGIPSVAVRLGMGKDGTPRGMILYGGDERKLLSAALALEKYTEPICFPACTTNVM